MVQVGEKPGGGEGGSALRKAGDRRAAEPLLSAWGWAENPKHPREFCLVLQRQRLRVCEECAISPQGTPVEAWQLP